MKIPQLLAILAVFSLATFEKAKAQDERFFRKMLSGELTREQGEEKTTFHHWKVRTPKYEIDIDGDFRNEKLAFTKFDGQDWLFLYSYDDKVLYKYRFDAKGAGSSVYKVRMTELKKGVKALIFYFFEGGIQHVEYQGTSRLFFLSVEKNPETNKMLFSMTKGPYFFEEFKSREGHYHRRHSKISIMDFDGDGFRDIAVRYYLITRVYTYKGNGRWERVGEEIN